MKPSDPSERYDFAARNATRLDLPIDEKNDLVPLRLWREQQAEIKRLLDLAGDHPLVMEQGGFNNIDRCHRVINKQQTEIERLRAIEAKLQVTADGVRWVPHEELWHPAEVGSYDAVEVEHDDRQGWVAIWGHRNDATGVSSYYTYAVEDCYSTQAAARARREVT